MELFPQLHSDGIFITKEYIMELNRFKQLLESTMGNVKPLINEQNTLGSAIGLTTSSNKYETDVKPQTTNDLTSKLKKVVIGYNTGYKQICDVCKQNASMVKPSSNAKKVANDFSAAISGAANPFDNFGGYEDEGPNPFDKDEDASPAHNTGKALSGLKNAEELCDMIINYGTYSGSDETFEEALSGELSYKIDSSENYRIMFADPVSKILNN